MKFSSALTLAAAAVSSVSAVPVVDKRQDTIDPFAAKTCTSPLQRKEWRKLTTPEKDAYISAVKCMMGKQPRMAATFAGSKSLYDDFQGFHIARGDHVHWVGQFLPFHRWLLHIWEQELRSTCGFTGAQPYWDWTLDAGTAETWSASPIFDPAHGFGGNGAFIADVSDLPAPFPLELPDRTGGGCLLEGPFSNLTVNMGPGASTDYTPHCLRRDFTPATVALAGNTSRFDWVQDAPDFFNYMRRVEGLSMAYEDLSTHASAHVGAGGQVGDMSNLYSSPGDPLFYLHHTQLDRSWDLWQRKNFAARKTDITGPDTKFAYPFNYFGDIPYQNVTLSFEMDYAIWGTVTIAQLMDTAGGPLCYQYV